MSDLPNYLHPSFRKIEMLPPGFRLLHVPIVQLNLELVLKCGQSFRWRLVQVVENDLVSPEWRLTLHDRVICLRQNSDTLFYRALFPLDTHELEDGSTLAWIRDYFQVDVDLDNIFSSIEDPIFKRATSLFGGGIRILRQDPWENLIS
jgi:N-glycosylase/DNA lyase